MTIYSKVVNSLSRVSIVAVAVGACVPAFAATPTSPVMVAVGNGGPLLGSSSSAAGVGVLTPHVNGNDTSLRLLGAEKTAGVSTTLLRGPDGRNTEVQSHTPIDGVANGLSPK